MRRTTGQQEPTLWLDKGCIDQTNIRSDLRCLPVFLSGCRSLVVLPGATYASRLWCVLEIFVYLRTGGTHERLLAYSLGGEEVKQALCRFDASKAKCFLRSDRERLLGVIEAAFGDCTPFNALVRDIFTSEGKVEEGGELSIAPVVGVTGFVGEALSV